MNANPLKIALLGNITTEFIGNAINNELSQRGLKAEIYNAPYKQYNQLSVDISSELYKFKPDVIFLLLDGHTLFPQWYSISGKPESAETCRKYVYDTFSSIEAVIINIHKNTSAKIIVNNFLLPYHTPMGIVDDRSPMGLKKMIKLLNSMLEEAAASTDYLYVFDYNGFCSHIGHEKALDAKLSYLVKNPLSYGATKRLAHEYMRYLLPLSALNKKCLVLDLDNTLWGGVAGEDGIGGIKLDISGEGASFYDFQNEILNLYNRGIILAINSKNNPEDVLDIMDKHPHMVLRSRYFSCMKINWHDKAENMKQIASELNIGPDSLVFFDDNPVERELIKTTLPQVTVVDVPADSGRYCDVLRDIVEFEALELTAEDRERNRMYLQNKEREQEQQKYKSLQEYLESLKTVITVSQANEFNIPRIAQLTQKTNQFNMTTRRYQPADIAAMLKSGVYKVYCCSVSDRFGDNGITGCCIVKTDGDEASIDTFLMSCRVLGRNAEYAFLSCAVNDLRMKGFGRIRAEFLPTEKNRQNSGFYQRAGFEAESGSEGFTFILESGMKAAEVDYITCATTSVKGDEGIG